MLINIIECYGNNKHKFMFQKIKLDFYYKLKRKPLSVYRLKAVLYLFAFYLVQWANEVKRTLASRQIFASISV